MEEGPEVWEALTCQEESGCASRVSAGRSAEACVWAGRAVGGVCLMGGAGGAH